LYAHELSLVNTTAFDKYVTAGTAMLHDIGSGIILEDSNPARSEPDCFATALPVLFRAVSRQVGPLAQTAGSSEFCGAQQKTPGTLAPGVCR